MLFWAWGDCSIDKSMQEPELESPEPIETGSAHWNLAAPGLVRTPQKSVGHVA